MAKPSRVSRFWIRCRLDWYSYAASAMILPYHKMTSATPVSVGLNPMLAIEHLVDLLPREPVRSKLLDVVMVEQEPRYHGQLDSPSQRNYTVPTIYYIRK